MQRIKIKDKKKGFDQINAHLARIPVKRAHCQVWLIGPKYTAAESAECWNRKSLMIKMA